jgi:5-bromo-4-chloroindolyl phosphate hydrolysis protein
MYSLSHIANATPMMQEKIKTSMTRRERWRREDLTREEIEAENKALHEANERLTEMLLNQQSMGDKTA